MNQIPCLENYIIIRDGCYRDVNGNPIATPMPVSGLYIEDLEGMVLENIAGVTSETLISATNTVNEKMLFAATIVEKRLKAILNARGIKLNKYGNKYGVCQVGTAFSLPAALDKGIRISKKWLGSIRSKIYVESVRLKSSTNGNTVLKISDLLGNVLWTMNATLVADVEQNYYVKEHFDDDVILITADATNVTLYEYTCDQNSNCSPCNDKYLDVNGWNGGAIGTGYMGACLRLDCTDKDIICLFLDRLGLAILYQTGAQIAREWASPNNRMNIAKTHGLEWAIEMVKVWESMSIEYLDNEIDNIIQELECDKFCYNCSPRLKMIPLIPS